MVRGNRSVPRVLDVQAKCKACTGGDCYGHVSEFIGAGHRVRKCHCDDPNDRHGKLRPRKESGE
jgi:hypothetical protein